MEEMRSLLARWRLTPDQVRQQIYRAATPRERERWHAFWLLVQGWSEAQVARTLERDPHTIGEWVRTFAQHGPSALAFTQTGGSPPPSSRSSKRS